MKVLNFGSLNMDYVYDVERIVRPGETISSREVEEVCGGKGLNQSVAMARAGLPVHHAGMVGEEGQALLDVCDRFGIARDLIRKIPGRSGHTIIQVDRHGQNCILLYGGANRAITEEFVDEALSAFGEGDILVLQNEVSCLSVMIDRAYDKGMSIVLNPSPYDDRITACDLRKVNCLFINEVEGEQMTGQTEPVRICESLLQDYPDMEVVLTLGADGAVYASQKEREVCPAFSVDAADTTAAGDTFTGYFLYGREHKMPPALALRLASAAAALAVGKKGAVPSIPSMEEVESFLNEAVVGV